jgi:hypothetical protein
MIIAVTTFGALGVDISPFWFFPKVRNHNGNVFLKVEVFNHIAEKVPIKKMSLDLIKFAYYAL